jgi:hypothetical protein
MEVVRGWPEEARLDLVVELAHDPWLAETVQQFALSDPSEKVKWNVARMLSWYGFREKVEHLLATLGDAAFREARRTMRAEEIPNSLWPRVVGLYEKMYTETAVPSERLGLLRMMKEFGAADVTERMKAVLEGLEEEQLKNGNEGGTKWALGEMRKTDPEWVSIWLGRIAPAGSTRFGGWNEMVSGLPTGEQERLLDEFSGAVLQPNEKQGVLRLLGATTNERLALLAFEKACGIRRGLSSAPGQDLKKWELFQQMEDLLRAIAPKILLTGLSGKLHEDAEATELEVLTDVLATFNPDYDRGADIGV